MDRLTQSILLVLIGAVLTSLELSGRFMLYVKAGVGPLLLAGGIALLAVGAISTALAMRGRVRRLRAAAAAEAAVNGGDVAAGDARAQQVAPPGGRGGAAHDGDHGGERPWAAWLLLLPVLVVLWAPPALGADAVARDSGSQALSGTPPAEPPAGADPTSVGAGQPPGMRFPPLPAGKNPVIPLKELVQRALYAPGSVSDTSVTVTGFIAAPAYGYTGGYSIAQLIISCCAADARAMQIQVPGGAPFPQNTWVTAVLTVRPGSGTLANGYVPEATVTSVTKVRPPADPYGR